MKRSAAASSCRVLTPGRILRSSSSSVATRISPARAILSTSASDFLMITRLQLLLEFQRRDGCADVVVHLVGAAQAIEAAQQPLVVVVGDQRLGLRVIDVEPAADRLLPVVVALVQARAVL